MAALAALGAPVASGAQPQSSTVTTATEQVRAYVAANARRCGPVQYLNASASPTTDAEITETRPAGFDVTLVLARARSAAQFLVADGHVIPDNPVAGALATGCSSDPAPPGGALAWHALPYLDVNTGRLLAGSSGPWIGAHLNRALPSPTESLTEGDGTPVWASRCAPGTQTVRFQRRLYLLGRPDTLRLFLQGVAGTGQRRPTAIAIPFTRYEVLINRRLAFTSTMPAPGGTVEIGSAARRALRFGRNTIELVVVKRATGACNGRSHHQYGVRFAITGNFHAHPEVTELPLLSTGACLNGTCSAFAETLPFAITNRGPATLLEPGLRLELAFAEPNGVLGNMFQVTETGLSAARCNIRELDAYHYEVVCGWAPLAYDAGGGLSFELAVRTPSKPPFAERFTAAWSSPALGSGRPAAGTRQVTVCSAAAGCPG